MTENSEELYEDANVETQHFIQAVIVYEQSADAEHRININWEHSHTWDEVLEVVDKAAQAHHDTSTAWGKVRKAFRSVGNHHKAFAAWVNILPTQSQYASIVCGGLKVVIGVRV